MLSPNYTLQTWILDKTWIFNVEYPPPYEWLVWDYRKANIESIQKSIKSVNWKNLLNSKIVKKQFSIFNETIMYIFSNFVSSHPTFTCSKLTIETLEQGVKYVQA